MKKFLTRKNLLIAGGILGLLLLLMICIPLLFKGQVVDIIKKQVNKNLNATVNFSSLGLNLFENFPDITLNIDDLTVINKEPFRGDTLIKLSQFEASVNLWSVISGDQIKINSISLDRPVIYLCVNKDSVANYDITKPTPKEAEKETVFNIGLKEYNIESAYITYIDETSGMKAYIRNFSHSGSGDFSTDIFNLDTKTVIEKLTVEMNSIPFLKNVNMGFDMRLGMNLKEKSFKFLENELRLNALKIKFNGLVNMNADSSIYTDVKFSSTDNNFKEIVSLIPSVYSGDFASAQANGSMSVKGNVKGSYKKESLPGFNIDLRVNNGALKYAKLPSKLSNVNMDLNISNPGGSANNTVINMSEMHLELGSDPFDAKLLVKTPVNSPFVEVYAKGKLNLAAVKSAIALKGVTKLAGLINADFEAKGYMADMKNKKAENISAKGSLSLNGFVYEGSQLKQTVNIPGASLNFTPKNFILDNLNMKIGENDIQAKGSLSNVISYLLNDATLSGNLQLNSSYFNLNPLMQNDETKPVTSKTGSKVESVKLPENVNFVMNANFSKLIYDNLNLENVKGIIALKDGRLNLQNLAMNLMGGSLTSTGYYENRKGTPDVSFNLNISNFDIQRTYENFVTVRTFAPMAKYIHGNFDAGIKLVSTLNGELVPEWKSFNSTGSLNMKSIKITGFQPFNTVSSLLKIDALKDPALYNIKPGFTVKDGRLIIAPFKFNLAGNEITMGGSNGIDKSIDYVMEMLIPASSLKTGANKAISSLFKRDISVIKTDKLPVKAFLKGYIDKPSVSTSAGNIAEDAVQNVKEEVKTIITKEVEAKKAEVQKKVEQKIDTVKKKVEDEATKKIKDIFKKW